jgi:hypothetical protein
MEKESERKVGRRVLIRLFFYCKRKRGLEMESIIVAIITGGLTLLGTIISNISSNKKIETNLKIQQAVTDTKIEALTSEVREHNNFAKRMPVVEEQIKVINHRINDLERKVG